jgi:3-dehydroquinate synthase class II
MKTKNKLNILGISVAVAVAGSFTVILMRQVALENTIAFLEEICAISIILAAAAIVTAAIVYIDINSAAKPIIMAADTLKDIKATLEIASGMNKTASGADQANATVNHTGKLCVNNRERLEVLMRQISLFKVA